MSASLRKIFVDANVLVAGADSRSGASHAVLALAEVGLFKLVTCTPDVAAATGLIIQMPGEVIQELLLLISRGMLSSIGDKATSSPRGCH